MLPSPLPRLVLAYLIACWTGGVASYASMSLVDLAKGHPTSIGELVDAAIFCALLLVVAAPVLAPFTVVALLLIHRFSHGGRWVYALAGCLVAPLGSTAWVVMDDGWPAFCGAFSASLMFSPAGAVAALVYRWIAGRSDTEPATT